MIYTKEIKIKIPENLTVEYVENELKKLNKDILHWAIVGSDEDEYTVQFSIVE